MKTKKIISELLLLVLFSSLLGTLSIVMAQEAPTPLYKISLVAPTNNPARMQYAQLIEKELPKLGFQTELSLLSWYPLLYRMGAFDEVGTYAEGGMDMGLIGFNIDPTAHPAGTCNSLFGRESVPPYGYNMVYWSDDNRSGNVDIYNTMKVKEAHEYLTKTLRETDPAILTDLFKEYQKIHYDVQALSFVYTEYRLHPISKGLYGFDPLYYPITSCEDQWLTDDYPGSEDLVILANSATPNAFNTRIVRDVYNQYVAGPVQDALCGSTPSANVFLPEDIVKEDWMKERYHDVFGTSEHSELYPRVAKALGTFSTDKLTYTIEVRDDVYFHDGHQLDAWDVAFSYQTYIVPDVGAPGYSTMRVAWGDDDKAAKHGNYSFEVVDTNADNFYETIKFHFNDTFGPWVDYVQAAIFPEHILGDPVTHGFDTNGDFDPDTLWQVMPRNFNTHSYNTGNPADEGGLIGPIGAGSMCFYSRDATSGIVDMKKFDGIKYDVASAKWVTDANLKHWRADQLDEMPTNYKVVPATLDGSLPELKAGTMNMLDPQWTMNNIYDELQTYEKANIILEVAGGWQALWYNPKFPGADDSYPFNKHGVRHALSHVIPREDIVTYLLAGLGVEVFSPIPINHAYASMSPEDMLEYKKTVKAADGSFPEADATTGFDDYNLETAYKWMEAEGYDMEPFREYYMTEAAAPGFELFIASIALFGTAAIISRRRR